LAAEGGGITFAGTAFAYVARLFIGILLARFLGTRQFGLYSLALTAAAIAAGLALLGLESAMVRYIAIFASRRDDAALAGVLQFGLIVTLVASLIVAGGLFLLARTIAERVFHEPELAPLLRLACLIVPILTLNNVIAAATRGFKNMQYTVIAQKIIQPLTRLILILTFAVVGLSATTAVSIHVLGLTTAFVFLLFFLNRQYPLRRCLQAVRRPTREILGFSLPVYATRLIGTFRGNLQTLFLGTLSSVSTAGIFSAATRVNLIGQMFHQSIATASRPIVSELHDRGDWKPIASFYQTTTKWTFTLNLPLFLVVLLFPSAILGVFGKGFVAGAAALSILAWRNLVEAGTGISGVVIDMTGRTNIKLVNTVITTVLILTLNILLIPRWGLVGAATAALIASLTINFLRVSEVFFLFRMIPYDASFLKPIAAGLLAFVVAWATRQLLHTESNLILAALNATLLISVYAGMILALGLSQEDRLVLTRLRKRTGRMFSRNGDQPAE
jgi:O-antigen/teichoic acid export membrane protein